MIELVYEITSINMNKKEFVEYVKNNNNDFKFIFYNWKNQNKKDRLKICKSQILDLEFIKN